MSGAPVVPATMFAAAQAAGSRDCERSIAGAVRCRTGSLEVRLLAVALMMTVRCRTGSRMHHDADNRLDEVRRTGSRNGRGTISLYRSVRCRTGSLESLAVAALRSGVRCRTGSLKWRLSARRGFSAVQAVLKTESSTTLSGKFPVAQTPQPRRLPSWFLQPQAPPRPPDLHPQHLHRRRESINAASSRRRQQLHPDRHPSPSNPAGSEIAAAPRKLAGRRLPRPAWRRSAASSGWAAWSQAGMSSASWPCMARA